MVIDNIQFLDYTGDNFVIKKYEDGTTYLKFNNGDNMSNHENFSKIMLGKCNTCGKLDWFINNFKDFTYSKVLVAGLGLGLIPQDLIINEKCSKVDVVEIDKQLIDYFKNINVLDSKINLIQGDIFEYTTTETYDLIIIDTIFNPESMSDSEYDTLVTKFNDNLSSGGALYAPIIKKWYKKI
tara:strand:- start:1976 stop:2521 length:546 start_codon:yes stop_codon:yes gene_type:complete